MIACDERGEIDVKGIAYPIATYRVLDPYADLESELRSLHEHHPHLHMDIDFAEMTATDREAAKKVLDQALRLLSQQTRSRLS